MSAVYGAEEEDLEEASLDWSLDVVNIESSLSVYGTTSFCLGLPSEASRIFRPEDYLVGRKKAQVSVIAVKKVHSDSSSYQDGCHQAAL
uniref:TFIIIC_sub6 domain-containing protein n=1 Tax=Steinernema glaseri TaxID=37863 RepID=A0A1I8APB8_9BILA